MKYQFNFKLNPEYYRDLMENHNIELDDEEIKIVQDNIVSDEDGYIGIHYKSSQGGFGSLYVRPGEVESAINESIHYMEIGNNPYHMDPQEGIDFKEQLIEFTNSIFQQRS